MIGMISCKEASYLASKKEEGKLSFSEKIKLQVHIVFCGMCKVFALQNEFLAKHARHIEEHKLNDDSVHLADTVKKNISSNIS